MNKIKHPEISDSKISQQRRNALIEGTIQSLAERGIAGTTVSTICSASNSSRGLIAHYFDNKEVLMAEALKHLYNSVSNSIQKKISKKGLTATERLYCFSEALFSPSVFTNRNRSAFLCLWHETRFNSIVRKANQTLYRSYVTRMETLFFEAALELSNTNKASVEQAHTAAIGFIGLSDGLWLGMSIHDKLVQRNNAINICHRFINHELAALEEVQ